MSIFIGKFENNYNINTATNNIHNYLSLNRYDNNSNIIFLNTDIDSYSDAVINFKNRYISGFCNDSYIISDNIINKNFVNINRISTYINNDTVNINNIINITNNKFNFNIGSTTNSSFNIYNNTLANNIFSVTSTNINIGNNINIGIGTTDSVISINNGDISLNNGILYTNNIKSKSGNGVTIEKLIFSDSVHDSANYNKFLSIINDKTDINYNNIPLLINRYFNKNNIIDIFTCNINKPIVRNFCIDTYGNVSIGSNLPNAMLYITPESHHSNVIFYNGYNSNSFIVNDKGCVGIGTTKPNGFLHIVRDDNNSNIINNPLINLNIKYDINSNILNSKITNTTYYAYNQTNYKYDNYDNNIGIDNVNDITNYIITDNNTYNYNNSYIAGFPTNITLKYILNNNDISFVDTDNINLKNTNLYRNYKSTAKDVINLTNIFYYPNIFFEGINVNNITTVDKNGNDYIFNYYIDLLPNDKPYIFDQKDFYTKIINKKFLTIGNQFFYINFTINIYYGIFYKSFLKNNIIKIDPPNLLYATSNNVFTTSISSTGKLNIGSKDANDYYDLYTLGNSRIDNIECYNIKSISGKHNINFSDCNISNINTSFITSNISKYIYSENATINNINVNYLNNYNIYSSNIISSNISCCNISNTNYSITNNNANFKMPIYIGNVINNNNKSYLKVNVDNDYKNGFEISSYNNLNPSLSINTNVNNYYPLINLSSKNCSYNICINSNNYANVNYYEGFQIYNMIGNNNSNIIFNHISYDNTNNPINILAIGNNNILTDISLTNPITNPNTNDNNKISIGIPTKYLTVNNGYTLSKWYQYFNDFTKINTSNMFNVYGSFNFSSINNKPLIRCNIASSGLSECINIGIGITAEYNNPDNLLMINGNTTFLNNVTCCNIINTKNCYVYNNLLAANIGSLSDIRIKTDLHIIENSLDIIKNISGYRYNRIDTKKKEIGLIAQEVNKVLPELISDEKNLLHISYGNLAGIFVECIKDLNDKIDKLKKELEDMRLKNDLL